MIKINDNLSAFHGDNMAMFNEIGNATIDVILTDPPYLYLKNQKLERKFDEHKFFAECKRILTDDGFIVLFGRGVSFYRWNTILDEMGFTFKEEIIWNKRMNSGIYNPLSRIHETISIFTKGKGIINVNRVPYLEIREFEIEKMAQDFKRINSGFKGKERGEIEEFLRTKKIVYNEVEKSKFNVSKCAGQKGMSRSVGTLNGIKNGLKEKSIIEINREHYGHIHPTQKPPRLLERLLLLVIPEKKERNEVTILDPFLGSFSSLVACHNLGLKGLGAEIDKEYFERGLQRITELTQQQKLF